MIREQSRMRGRFLPCAAFGLRLLSTARDCEGPASETLQHCCHPLRRHPPKGHLLRPSGVGFSALERHRSRVGPKVEGQPRRLLVQMLVLILCSCAKSSKINLLVLFFESLNRTKLPSTIVQKRPDWCENLRTRPATIGSFSEPDPSSRGCFGVRRARALTAAFIDTGS
jgi:hypothetical protein